MGPTCRGVAALDGTLLLPPWAWDEMPLASASTCGMTRQSRTGAPCRGGAARAIACALRTWRPPHLLRQRIHVQHRLRLAARRFPAVVRPRAAGLALDARCGRCLPPPAPGRLLLTARDG